MRFTFASTILFAIAAAAPTIAAAEDAHINAPSYWDLESHYSHDIRLGKSQDAAQMDLARATLGASVPAGTPIGIAEARLQAGGASCRTDRHATGVVKCLYHQYDLSDGAADDIRWTVTLRVASDEVADLAVDRYVDRHGSN